MGVRTRSQGLTASVAQDLERDLLMAAVSLDDKVVVDLKERFRDFIGFRRTEPLEAVRNKLLRQMDAPSGRRTGSRRPTPSPMPDLSVSTPSAPPSTVVDALPSPPPPSPVPALSVETAPVHVACPQPEIDAESSPAPPSPVFELSVGTPFVHASCPTLEVEGPLGPLTLCDTQCAGCLDLRAENATLQQAEQQASERIAMLEAENQHLRSLSQERDMPEPAARADAAAATEIAAEASVPESSVSTVLPPPLPPVRVAQNLQVVVRGLHSRGTATRALLESSFSAFCRDQLHLRGTLTMHVVRVFDNPQPGTIAGVVALQSVRALEALFTAKRQHLRADAGVSIEPNRTRAQRLACTLARRARRATPSAQRSGAAEGRIDVAGQQRSCSPHLHASRSTLRADAPEFVPASAALSQHTSSPLSSVVRPVHALHQE